MTQLAPFPERQWTLSERAPRRAMGAGDVLGNHPAGWRGHGLTVDNLLSAPAAIWCTRARSTF